jgi:hypothetical protein
MASDKRDGMVYKDFPSRFIFVELPYLSPMRIKLSELRSIIRESIEEVLEAEDLNKDGKNDFEDVMIARMKASGMDHEEAVEKGEKAAKGAKKQKNEKAQTRAGIFAN